MASVPTHYARPNPVQVAGPGWFRCLDYSTSTGFQSELQRGPFLTGIYVAIEGLVVDPELAIAVGSPILRKKVETLPIFDCRSGFDLHQQRRAFTILSLVSHGYIWGDRKMEPLDRLPPQLAIPLHALGYQLGLPPLATWASTVLWNCGIVDFGKGWVPENVEVELTFTKCWEEKWFYATSACIEVEGSSALNSLLSIVSHLSTAMATDGSYNDWLVMSLYRTFRESMERMIGLIKGLGRMNSETFCCIVRPYLAGWSSVRSAGTMRRGVHYMGIDNADERREYDGVSAAQSSLFQCLDVLLGIVHAPRQARVLAKARLHMPGKHRSTVEALEMMYGGALQKLARDSPEMADAYNGSVDALARFRAAHLMAANKFLLVKSRRSGPPNSVAITRAQRGGEVGAEGAMVKEFLKGTLQATKSSVVK